MDDDVVTSHAREDLLAAHHGARLHEGICVKADYRITGLLSHVISLGNRYPLVKIADEQPRLQPVQETDLGP
ncbi:MAG: hypothetical protein N838_19605 [Thiohalocapsa sp. PB-PSB1]|nr:MAG: hypothetical protein N838_19605 [Thiohalocapsa sp. PB-PSB1]